MGNPQTLTLKTTPLANFVESIYRRCYKEDLYPSLLCVRSLLQNNEFELSRATTGVGKRTLDKFLSTPEAMNVEELKNLQKWLSCTMDNVVAFAEMDEGIKRVWHALITRLSVSYEEVCQLLGRELTVAVCTDWSHTVVPEVWLCISGITLGVAYNSFANVKFNKINFFLPQTQRRMAADAFFGKSSVNLEKLKELPAGNGLKVENFESYISTDLAFLQGLYDSGALIGKTDNITPAKFASVSKKLASPGFVREGGRNAKRHRLLIQAYVSFMLYVRNSRGNTVVNSKDSRRFAKFLLTTFPGMIEGPVFQSLLPEYKGFTRSWSSNSRASQIVEVILTMLKTLYGSWGDLSHFEMCYLCNDKGGGFSSAFLGLFSSEAMSRNTMKYQDGTDVLLGSRRLNMWNDFTRPFALNFLKLLCAAGMLQMAVDPDAPEDDPLEGMRYIKLTPLGLYALGMSMEYQSHVIDSSPHSAFEPDENAPIVTVSKPGSPYVAFLEKVGTQISPTRFKVTPEEIVQSCSSKEEVESKMENFIKFICPEPSPFWQSLIEETRRRSSVMLEGMPAYKIYHLNKDVPGLIRFIAGNEQIRQFSLRAENHVLLVKNKHVDDFEKILRKNGFLV